ncbi:MAG: thioredoxin domain-containing protein [Candidatus Thiodiazotropha lotti]|uniref:thioredoxin family protein n=1 Tax=Candidatus Thiodiazotropha endoloripes TaxID=1818881 RepID=UPI00083E115E|nr:thioredoxin domain-containing protein [Candidatus Thiodiazotropha endoloripes]MCG7903141.1 thioredoxin domain-containing protein [Candidatus Thiodiazotropha weberae]MCG7991281.1 thioredoxin domain-containing protein [Candidatus Thiodiazotropha lotti]MCG7998307.1 thioredoxin domain-containing protein [Candidatus Thiodiazotropha lotti]MCW4182936.1 thioredoxin domain-containing protein [Candidatus Thiodiazotropha weberae]MCW4190073.1 thioredoxin domain-containing protein [Candidatus Thiodiazot
MSNKKQTPPYIYDVDETVFDEQVITRSQQGPVLVDFWAEWCAPCISLAPALVRVVSEYEGRIQLAKLEVDDNMRLAGRYRLRGFPTVILFVDGEEKGRFHGSRASHWIREWVVEHLGDF